MEFTELELKLMQLSVNYARRFLQKEAEEYDQSKIYLEDYGEIDINEVIDYMYDLEEKIKE